MFAIFIIFFSYRQKLKCHYNNIIVASGATEFLTLDGTELKTTSSPIDFTTDGQFIIEITGSDDDVASSLTGVISLTITISM